MAVLEDRRILVAGRVTRDRIRTYLTIGLVGMPASAKAPARHAEP